METRSREFKPAKWQDPKPYQQHCLLEKLTTPDLDAPPAPAVRVRVAPEAGEGGALVYLQIWGVMVIIEASVTFLPFLDIMTDRLTNQSTNRRT